MRQDAGSHLPGSADRVLDQESALAPRLAAALERIAVSTSCRAASVEGHQISAGGPAELRDRLARMIYDVLHAGRGAQPAGSAAGLPDTDLEASLLAVMPHREVIRDVIVLAADERQIRVRIGGVKVRLPADQAAEYAGQPVASGTRLAIRVPAARPALSPGFFAADGTVPLSADEPVLRVYVHLRTTAAAVAAWGSVLHALESGQIGYRAKVSSLPGLLPRRDALVVYLSAGDTLAASLIASAVSGIGGVGESVSVFTERIGAGVATAWELTDRTPGASDLSFGEHRSRAVATGLVRHASSGGNGTPAAAVRRSLLDASIDPANPARNQPS